MNKRLVLKIQKRSQTEWLLWMIFMMPFLLGTFNGLLGLPYALRYIVDVAWIILFCYQLIFYKEIKRKEDRLLLLWLVGFAVYTMLGAVFHFQSPFYYFWGFRNNFRYYVVFFALAAFVSVREMERFLALFDKLFWLNFFVSIIQYFVLDVNGDYLGGIFGVESGVNAYTNIFFIIVITKSILCYLSQKEKIGTMIAKTAASFLIAALAELKFYYVEFVLIILVATGICDFTWRKVWMILGGFVGLFVGVVVLRAVFPDSVELLALEKMWETAISVEGYTSSGDLNRLNAISIINNRWLTSWSERIFGLGLGNCETSTFAFLNTPFFKHYGDLHYTWISYAFMYLECGWVGLFFFFGFFLLVYFIAYRIEKRSTGVAVTYCRLARIVSILCMVISAYNSSLRTEAGYMAYFVLSIPFVYGRSVTSYALERKEVDL